MATTGKALGRSVALAMLLVRPVAAQDQGFQLPAECGSEAEFSDELGRLVGAEAERARPTTLAISRASPEEDYRLTLVVGGERRDLSHADCRVLFRSALVIAAASVRPPAESEPAEAPPPVPPPPPPPPPPEPLPVEEPSEPGLPVGGSLSGGVGLALGVLPEPALVLELRGAVLVGMFGFSLSGKYLPPRVVAEDGREVDIHAFGLRPALLVTPIEQFSLSAGVDIDLLAGAARGGIATPGEDSAWTVAPSLELALIPINTKHLALEVALQGRFAVQRPVFEVTGFGEVYQVPPLGMLAVARGVWHFL
ncbi:MAG TPA: hypothetical protein VGK73_10885 [Polyangiaceae bacterium]